MEAFGQFCRQACRTIRTVVQPSVEPVHRHVEPVEPAEFKVKKEAFVFLYRTSWFYWFYTPVHRFYAWFYGGRTGSTRLPAKSRLAVNFHPGPGLVSISTLSYVLIWGLAKNTQCLLQAPAHALQASRWSSQNGAQALPCLLQAPAFVLQAPRVY